MVTDPIYKTEQAAVDAMRDYLASIVDSSADAIIAKRLDGTITAWNGAAERMFGYKAGEMIGQSIMKLFPPDLTHEEAEIISCIRSGRKLDTYETRRTRKDGGEIMVSLTVSPIRNAGGEIIGASKIVRDITERKATEARLNGLQDEIIHLSRWNMMGSMASSIAHELNQPLAAMTNYLAALKRVLERRPEDRRLLLEIADKAAQQGQRAATIVHHLRELVAKGKSQRNPAELGAVVQEALELSSSAMRQFGVRVILEVAADLPRVEIDRVQIQQVIINLARNAAEAMGGCPVRELQIKLLHRDNGVEVRVADTGPGLPSSVTDHLFEAFVTTKSSGMGLGLSICQQIVSAHGGVLRAAPNTPNGTVFSFTLPTKQVTA
ncbi:MAG: PAS domain S-box protein [Alphaproteobacteria bacterium]|nr:PAS domain S-box protein [Alphaproteobacteria bacterium]